MELQRRSLTRQARSPGTIGQQFPEDVQFHSFIWFTVDSIFGSAEKTSKRRWRWWRRDISYDDYKPFRVLGPRARVKLSNLKLFHSRGPILSFKAFLVCPVQNFLDSCGFLPFGSLVRWLGRKIFARRPFNNRNEVSHRAQLKETLKEYGFAKGLPRFEIYGFRSFCVCWLHACFDWGLTLR